MGIGQITIMCQAHLHIIETEEERLDIVNRGPARRCIADVADGCFSCKIIQICWVFKNLCNQAQITVAFELSVVI